MQGNSRATGALLLFLSIQVAATGNVTTASPTPSPNIAPTPNALCPAPQVLPGYMKNPILISAWIQNPAMKIKSIDDLVCCLPSDFQDNYLVAHSSVAAQNGTPNSPRVILFNQDDPHNKGQPPQLMMSINCGGRGMEQTDSIEMAYRNPQTNQLEFYDLNMKDSGQPVLSAKNPETCMNCHGDSGKVPPGGPKYIFDPFDAWQRFAGGAPDCRADVDQLQAVLSDQAVQSVKSSSRFKCLNKDVLKKDPSATTPSGRYPRLAGNLGDFDNRNLPQAASQAGHWIVSLPKYQQYKYMLAAENICRPMSYRDWMPPEILRKDVNNLNLAPALKQNGDLIQNYLQGSLDRLHQARADRQALQQEPQAKLFAEGINPDPSAAACQPDMSDQDFLNMKKNLINIEKQNGILTDQGIQYRDPAVLTSLDGDIRGPLLGQDLPSTGERLFLEGEGYGTYMVQSSASPGDLVRFNLDDVPMSLEPSGSDLRALFTESKNPKDCWVSGAKCLNDSEGKTYLPRNKDTICADLKTLSNKAFSKPIVGATNGSGIN